MRELKIAYGDSCFSKKWSNKLIKFSTLCERLKNTIRTSESVEEYPRLSKDIKDRTKDKGGFVGGALKSGRRKSENVECRSMLTLDIDKADAGFLERYEMLYQYASCVYTTHSHTPTAPRLRLIVPLVRDVSADEYVALARYFAADWGIEAFDECSYRPAQLMYWPTTPSNGEYIFRSYEGEWLNPDTVLTAHSEWQDPTQLPTSSRESVVKSLNNVHQADPLTKEGIVGLFNRAYYPIQSAIESFLSDVYESTDNPNRYRYKESTSMPGVEVIEDKFVYSHHAKDPAYLKLCSAFDLVRIHLFGDKDEKASFTAMTKFALEQYAVNELAYKTKLEQIPDDFKNIDDWHKKLTKNPKNGSIKKETFNLLLILNNDPDFANIAFNELANRIEVRGYVPWSRPERNRYWREADYAQLRCLIDIKYAEFSMKTYEQALQSVVDERRFNPVRDYLESLVDWDGVKRLDTLLIDYFGAKDTTYTRTVTRKTLVAAVARSFEPGTKFDSALVLIGAQGIGKSTFFYKLAGEWFSDNLSIVDMKDKSGAEKLQGFWLLELSEMAGMKKVDIETIKGFISRTDDNYRPSYGRVNESHLRRCIIVGSTNAQQGFLRDITGNRRFWPVELFGNSTKKSWDMTKEDVSQIWAEALHCYKSGEVLYLEGSVAHEAELEQQRAMESDERQGIVEDYLNVLLPDDWDKMSIYDRRDFLSGNTFEGRIGKNIRGQVSNLEIWCECFGNNLNSFKQSDSYAIAAIMAKIEGWTRSNKRIHLKNYGRQRIYERLS